MITTKCKVRFICDAQLQLTLCSEGIKQMTEMIDRYASPVDAAVFQTITKPDFVD